MILDLLVGFLLTDDTSCGFEDPTVGWVATDCPPAVQEQLPDEVIGRAIDCADGSVGYVVDAAGTVVCTVAEAPLAEQPPTDLVPPVAEVPAPVVEAAPVEAPAAAQSTPVAVTPARVVTGKWVQFAQLSH